MDATAFQRLGFAEDLARWHGDYAKFKEIYNMARETFGIEDSIRIGLNDQNLLPKYMGAIMAYEKGATNRLSISDELAKESGK